MRDAYSRELSILDFADWRVPDDFSRALDNLAALYARIVASRIVSKEPAKEGRFLF